MNKVIWKVSSKDLNQASFRYRCLIPLRWMKVIDGQSKHIVADNSDILILDSNVKGIIFVKAFSKNDLNLAKKALQLRIPIYVDLCDNFFYRHNAGQYNNSAEKELLRDSFEVFGQIAAQAKLIVTTGIELADKICEEFPELKDKIKIVPDSIEDKEDLDFFKYFKTHQKEFREFNFLGILRKIPKYILKINSYVYIYWKTRSLFIPKKSAAQIPATNYSELDIVNKSDLKKVLWFGNSGIPNLYGITDIILMKDALLQAYQKVPFMLIVCSKEKKIFDQYISPLEIETCFIDWTLENNNHLLKICDVVLTPNPKNEFTIGKSANRTLLALSFKKPVLTTFVPALETLESLVSFDHWEENLVRYLKSPSDFEKTWEAQWKNIQFQFSSRRNGENWANILKEH